MSLPTIQGQKPAATIAKPQRVQAGAEQKKAPEKAPEGDRVALGPETKEKGAEKPGLKGLLDGLESNFSADGGPSVSREKLAKMNQSQRDQLEQMRKVDKAVERHENDHYETAGSLAQGGPTYTTKLGPDGNAYRVAGEVKIDTAKAATPEETIKKMEQVKRAAMAPDGNVLCPLSDQDRKVAAEADLKRGQAEFEQSSRETQGQKSA